MPLKPSVIVSSTLDLLRLWTPKRAVKWGIFLSQTAFVLSLAMAYYLGNSKIDIGVDTLAPPYKVPSLIWGGLADPIQVSMEQIQHEFTPGGRFFELTADGKKNPAATESAVLLLQFPYQKDLRIDPPGSWMDSPPLSLFTYGRLVSKLQYVGNDNLTSIRLMGWPTGGIVNVKTARGTQVVDLYSPTVREITVPIPADPKSPVRRYHQVISRRALRDLRLKLTGITSSQIQRVYVGSAKPVILSPTNHFDPKSWGTQISGPLATDGKTPLPLPAYCKLESGGIKAAAVIFALLMLGLAASLAVSVLAVRLVLLLQERPLPSCKFTIFQPVRLLAFFIPLVCVWSFYLLVFFPGVMSPDSLDQWNQIHTNTFLDVHPILHTLTYQMVCKIWDSPAAVGLFQILVIGLIVAYGFELLVRLGINQWAIILAYLTVLLSPRNGCMVITLWKDVLYSGLIFLLTAVLIRGVLDREHLRSKGWWAVLGLILILLPLYRHNGILILAGFIPLLPLFLPGRRKMALAVMIGAFLVYYVAKQTITHKFEAEPNSSKVAFRYEMHVLPTSLGIAKLADQDAPFSQAELDFLSSIRSFEDRWGYDLVSEVNVIYTPLFHMTQAVDHLAEYESLYQDFFKRYPLLMLGHLVWTKAYLFVPWQIEEGQIFGYPCTIGENTYGLKTASLIPGAHKWMEPMVTGIQREPSLNWLFLRPALHFYLVLLALACLLWRTRQWHLTIIYLPVLINMASVLIGAHNQAQRFQYPLVLTTSLLVCLGLFLRKRSFGEAQDSPSRNSAAT